MNYKHLALIVGTLCTLKTAIAADTLTITEQDESITVTLNGTTAVPFNLSGPKDGWTIELLGDYSFSPNLVGANQIILPEPEDATVNIISITQPTFMIWESDVPLITSSAVSSISTVIPGGAISPAGAPLDLVLVDAVTVTTPDAGSTFALAGLAITALAGFRRKCS
jgi:hypothetical protein